MKRRKIGVAFACLVVILALLLVWGLFPRRFLQIYDIQTEILSMTSTSTKSVLNDEGETDMQSYTLISMDEDKIWIVMDMLCHSTYRPDFWNLLPFAWRSLSAESTEEAILIDISQADGDYSIQFLGSNLLVISEEGKRDKIFYIKNASVCSNLTVFTMKYGTEQKI